MFAVSNYPDVSDLPIFPDATELQGTEVIIRSEGDQGIEVQVLKSYGCGLDVHSCFIAVCVHVRNNNRVFKYMADFNTDWNSLLAAKQWVIDTIRKYSNPVPDLRQPLHYVLEATSTYHMPILRAWGDVPSVINPMLAGATKKKTDVLDAERLSFHDLTGVWPESFVATDDLSELRVLLAERNNYAKLATQCSNRINNIIVRFGITVGRGTSVTRNPEVRAIVEDLASECPSVYDNLCPDPLPSEVKVLIQKEYRLYDRYVVEAENYMSCVRQKVYSMDWETKDSTLPGSRMVDILCTTPGVGEISCFTWLAYVGTPRRFPNAKALAAYCGLDPSLKVSAGKVTSTKKRGGCRVLHAILATSADRIIRAHSEAFGRWGYLMAKSSGKWGKTTNAVGRKLCVAIYHMMMTGMPFSYENYHIMDKAAVFDISIDELPMLNPDFKRYVKILHENDIHTTVDMITAYLTCSLAGMKGLGNKFFAVIRDFLQHQHKYQLEYKKLHPTANVVEIQ